MKKLILFFAFISFFSFSYGQMKKGYEISVSISGLPDSTLFLAYHFGDKQYLKDTIKLDNKGQGVFSGKEALPQGIYLVVLPGKQYFEVLLSENQHFGVKCSFPDYINSLKFTDSDENTDFVKYQRHWVELQKIASGIVKRIQINKQNQDSLKILTEKQKVQEEAMKSYLHSIVAENDGKLLSALVKAMLPVEVPEFRIPAFARNPDSIKWIMNYMYNKDHFFDNIDLNDERLLRTPLLQAKLNAFFTNVVVPAPDSINKEIDKLIEKVKGNYKVFQFVAVYLFNHFRESEIMGHDAVVVKLADDIYLTGKADWVTQEFKDDLRKQVEMIRPNLIGKKAHDLVMDSYKGVFVSLYDIDKEFTILYFWEPNCGHCKEATPKLKAYYDKAKTQGVEVFAVCTTSEREKWEKYIEENKLDWINGWDPERKSNFGFYYNVQATPTVYILDKNKTIIAKKLSVDDIPSFIENYRKYFRK
jgi:thiol-disulfide isomerase/thioredoxin